MPSFRMTLLVLALMAIVGCSSAPEPKLYFLDSSKDRMPTIKSSMRIGLAEISLPTYARNQKISSMSGNHRIIQDDDHRWAVPPAEALSVALSQALEYRLATPVVLSPYPRGLAPKLQLRVAFDHFIRNTEGAVELYGQYLIVSGSNETVTHVKRFKIQAPAEGAGYEAYMIAVTDGINQLADKIALNIDDQTG